MPPSIIVEIGRVYVVPEFRNHNIATNLSNIVEDKCHELGAKRIILDTYKRFESAINLYKKLGFHEIESYKKYSPYTICMAKDL